MNPFPRTPRPNQSCPAAPLVAYLPSREEGNEGVEPPPNCHPITVTGRHGPSRPLARPSYPVRHSGACVPSGGGACYRPPPSPAPPGILFILGVVKTHSRSSVRPQVGRREHSVMAMARFRPTHSVPDDTRNDHIQPLAKGGGAECLDNIFYNADARNRYLFASYRCVGYNRLANPPLPFCQGPRTVRTTQANGPLWGGNKPNSWWLGFGRSHPPPASPPPLRW